jgi:hypothetical protein
MIADVTKRLNQTKSNTVELPSSPLNSFWSQTKKDPEKVNAVTKVLTEENRLTTIEHNFEFLILSAVSVLLTKREIDNIELKKEPETTSDNLAVTKVDNEEPDMVSIMTAMVAGISLLMYGFATNIYKMLMKTGDKLHDSLGNVIGATSNYPNTSVDNDIQNQTQDVRKYTQQQKKTKDQSTEVSLQKEKEYDMRQVKTISGIMSSSSVGNKPKSSVSVVTSVDKDNQMKTIDNQSVRDISIAIDYSEGLGNDPYQGDVKSSTQTGGIFSKIWETLSGGKSRSDDIPDQVKLPSAKRLTDKEVEGISAKPGVDLHEANPVILDRFKKIEKDIGYNLVISSTVSDHRRATGRTDTRHDSGLAVDISFASSPILQSETGRTLVLKAALKEGITGIGFEGNHMHIDLVPGMKAHWGGKIKGPGSGFTPEQERLFGEDPNKIILPPLPPAPTDRNKGNGKQSKSFWQSIESYFGAEEPTQGNKHHAGT